MTIERHGTGNKRESDYQIMSWVYAICALLFVLAVLGNWTGVIE